MSDEPLAARILRIWKEQKTAPLESPANDPDGRLLLGLARINNEMDEERERAEAIGRYIAAPATEEELAALAAGTLVGSPPDDPIEARMEEHIKVMLADALIWNPDAANC